MKRILALLALCAAVNVRAEMSVLLESSLQHFELKDDGGKVGASAPIAGLATQVSSARGISEPAVTARNVEIGAVVSASSVAYYLGDTLRTPANVDWVATYAAYLSGPSTNSFFFCPQADAPAVYIARGGVQNFTWVLKDGTQVTESFRVANTSQGRPKRIYWTNGEYRGPEIDLSGRFVRFYGDPSVLTVTTDASGTVTRGLYYNTAASKLSAYNDPNDTPLVGHVLMVYYDSGLLERVIHVQVVQVLAPEVKQLKATVGAQLQPDGDGYPAEGLVASPTQESVSDPKDGKLGPYLYQHKGQHSWSPKNDAVFAIRPTEGAAARSAHATIWWKAPDEMNVLWPFVQCSYQISWPEDPVLFVRGEVDGQRGMPMYIPSSLTTTLMEYQSPVGHASDPVDGAYSTTGEGRSLLKLTGSDNIWFVPVESVFRDNKKYFTLESVDWDVGAALVPRGGSVSGLASNVAYHVDADLPGYLNAYPKDASVFWAEQYYVPWSSATAPTTADGAVSAIFPVNADGKTLEVWWMRRLELDDCDEALIVPTLPQVYRPSWPATENLPSIVFASQQGSANESVFNQTGAILFDAADSRLDLLTRRYFDGGKGTAMFWVRRKGSGGATDLVSLNGLAVRADDKTMRVSSGASATTVDLNCSNLWCHVAIVVDGTVRVFVNGVKCGSDLSPAAEIADVSSDAHLGGSTSAGWNIAELKFFSAALTADEISDGALRLLNGSEAGLEAYWSFRSDDLEPTEDGVRYATERCLGVPCEARGVLQTLPGPPARGKIVFASDSAASIYVQNDQDKVGFNPNEEHATIMAGSGGYVAWAARDDLNAAYGFSPAVVLVRYLEGTQQRMQALAVKMTGDGWTMGGEARLGSSFPGPHPFDYYVNGWNTQTSWTSLEAAEDSFPIVYRDRKNVLWPRAAGKARMQMCYPLQAGFYQQGKSEGDVVPWSTNVWDWAVSWPTNGYLKMGIGRTLTTAADGLPEVWGASSMSVIYPINKSGVGVDEDLVTLWDPTVRREIISGLSETWYEDYGLSFGESGDVTTREGRQCFNGAPPSIGNRLYVEPSSHVMYLEGARDSDGYLSPNFVTAEEKKSLRQIRPDNLNWTQLVDTLPTAATSANEMSVSNGTVVVTKYNAVDHYALTTLGGTNWIVLVENDGPKSMVSEGSAISMKVIRIEPQYYLGRVITVQDENDKLSQKLTIKYTESFAGHADRFHFEWATSLPLASGRIPDPDRDFTVARTGTGLTSFTIGEQGESLTDLVDTYHTVRFKALDDTPAHRTMGDAWSARANPPALAEGWLKRCLNNVTPFTQRMSDLEKNRAETGVSMIVQAGAPYEGDVALNSANLTSVGLIQLYTTLLNKGETMSLAKGENVAAANSQLLLAVERLTELYTVLGDEAWADALNPTIGFGSNFGEVESGLKLDYGALSSKLFCFDNQVASLLDEELCLLRGRSGTDAPATTLSPCYNRLIWNFTRGLTAGEVAYAVNYDITGLQSTTLGYEQAKAMYPQGHGDAYGHYLSALTPWYRLLRNPYFTWPTPAKDSMNVGTTVVNVRYENEAKFANAAANVAKTAARVVEMTGRAAWRDNGVAGSGTTDASSTNAFGYAEWAARGGYGALVNWVVGNSLLPADRTIAEEYHYESPYEDLGLERIDRGTTDELAEICDYADEIQNTLDRLDAGFNPLGLSENAVPFDISPIGATDGTKTHYEQIADRAQVALDNAQKVLDEAQENANRLRLIAEAESGIDEAAESMENDYDAELVAIFGRPYDDDVGPTGTYKQGYTGPDLYHYAWMDLSSYGLDEDDTVAVTTAVATVVSETDVTEGLGNSGLYDSVLNEGQKVSYALSRNGLLVKPSNIRGTRKANGTIQLAYADYLSAYAKLKQSATTYRTLYSQAEKTFAVIKNRLSAATASANELATMINEVHEAEKEVYSATMQRDNASTSLSGIATIASRFTIAQKQTVINHLLGGDLVSTVAAGVMAAVDLVNMATTGGLTTKIKSKQYALAEKQAALEKYETELNARTTAYEMWEKAVSTTSELNAALEALLNAETDAVTAAEKISAEVESGSQTLSARTLARKRVVNNVAKLRYNDMLFRLTRNESLTRYSAAYDIAQRYTFLAAKAYGYDSGLLDAESGSEFLCSIAAERSLGALQETKEKMDANWLGLKGRLGLNNPQPYATWFSLRSELYRVLSTASGDRAWRNVLEQHYVEDLNAIPEYGRLCQPVASVSGSLAMKEPGFVFEFPTSIDFGKNFFGKTVAEGDHAFDSTYFATKVKAAGVWLEGYSEQALGANPVCYLIPAGEDRMRVPGAADSYAAWNVIDQVVPLPYSIGTTELSSSTWFPTFDGQTAGADSLARVRLYPSFRAYYGARGVQPDDSALDSPRLVGRSVWNTKWMIVIPAGAMYADREKACDRFMSMVSDIKLGLKTYSNSGN